MARMKIGRFALIVIGVILLDFLLKELLWEGRVTGLLTQSIADAYPKAGDYLGYALMFFLPAMLAFFFLESKSSFVAGLESRLAGVLKSLWDWFAGLWPKALPIALVVFWIVTLLHKALFKNLATGEHPFDSHHEGERLAYLQTFLHSDKPFLDVSVNLGFGISVLPSLLAAKLFNEPHQLMATRFIFTGQILISWLSCIWILWELSKTFSPERELQTAWFAFTSGMFALAGDSIIAQSTFFSVDFVHTFFLFQLAMLVRILRLASSAGGIRSPLIIVTLGLTLPLGILYSVKYGMLFWPLFVFSGMLAFVFGREFALRFWGGSLAGAAAGAAGMYLALGSDQIASFFRDAAYWPKYWNFRFAIPLFTGGNYYYIWIMQVVILAQILTLVYLWRSYRGCAAGFKEYLRQNALPWLIFAVSILFTKLGMDRSDKFHFRQAALPALLLFPIIGGSWWNLLDPGLTSVRALYQRHKTLATVLLLSFLAINMHPSEAARRFKPYYKKIFYSDIQMIEKDYALAIQTMSPEMQDTPCFFTMTSEGVWHYFFKKPSCTRILYPIAIIPEDAQREAIASLETKKPEYILYSNTRSLRGQEHSDYAVLKTTLIHGYIKQHYRPYKLIGSHWFWKRAAEGAGATEEVISVPAETGEKENHEPG